MPLHSNLTVLCLCLEPGRYCLAEGANIAWMDQSVLRSVLQRWSPRNVSIAVKTCFLKSVVVGLRLGDKMVLLRGKLRNALRTYSWKSKRGEAR